MIASISAHAWCTSPMGPYETRIDSMRGGRVRLEQTSDRGRFLAFADGDASWSVDDDGTIEQGGDALRHAVLNHDFHMLTVEPGRIDAPVIKDGRVAGFDTPDSRDPGRTVRVRYHEWTDVEGTELPSVVIVSSHEGDFVLRFDRIELNAVDESVFVRD